MKSICPYCGKELVEGQAEIHGTILGFLLVGFSYQNLYFKPNDDNEIKVLKSNCSTPALRCENCEILILNKDNSNSSLLIDDAAFSELTKNNMINLIRLWSSRDLQDEFQRSDQEINILDEMYFQWIDNYKPEMEDFRNSFQEATLDILSEFDLEIRNIFEPIKMNIPDYYDYVESEDWRKLNYLAKKIIQKLDEK